TAANIVLKLLIPSLVCLTVPLIIMSFRMKGNIESPIKDEGISHEANIPLKEKKLVLYLGLGALLFVPIFKTVTHLPPFMGVLLGLSILWATTELLHRKKEIHAKKSLSIGSVLEKVDTASILFFLGILLAVAALQTAGHLTQLADILQSS